MQLTKEKAILLAEGTNSHFSFNRRKLLPVFLIVEVGIFVYAIGWILKFLGAI